MPINKVGMAVLCALFKCIYIVYCMYILLALTTGDPTSKISYTEINANQVVGWPQFVSFCHPNNLSISELEKVSSAMKEIKFKPGLCQCS